MKRLSGRQPDHPPIVKAPETPEVNWEDFEGFSGWFPYKLSKYLALGIYPIPAAEEKGKRLKARNKLNLSRLSGQISILDMNNIYITKGTLSNCTINSIRIKNTKLCDNLWKLIEQAKSVVLNNVDAIKYKEEYFSNARSIDILGDTVRQIGNKIVDLINIKVQRIRIADKNILIFWDARKCYTCVLRYFDTYKIVQRIPIIRIIHFDGIEMTMPIIKELRRHPIITVKLIGCRIHPIKIYDLVSTCEDTLKHIEFNKTPVPLATVDSLRSKGLVVTVL
ncbi:hypothetical protein NEAUS04_0834 [Nematocida ausubeli]|nr:hypothetical protein NEAUS06_0589 [Nematocida ausubeli]KAI5133700.1 hypothetical protein NEAUS07_0531 [Nematocida ausubeli]KAI5147277.1 hypothetical protein NEAUS05_0591 [Nematocida ausubeli]KAI5162014.1 hypothetical protein NEAUS04_0834 [Nematocida ausubeli]